MCAVLSLIPCISHIYPTAPPYSPRGDPRTAPREMCHYTGGCTGGVLLHIRMSVRGAVSCVHRVRCAMLFCVFCNHESAECRSCNRVGAAASAAHASLTCSCKPALPRPALHTHTCSKRHWSVYRPYCEHLHRRQGGKEGEGSAVFARLLHAWLLFHPCKCTAGVYVECTSSEEREKGEQRAVVLPVDFDRPGHALVHLTYKNCNTRTGIGNADGLFCIVYERV